MALVFLWNMVRKSSTVSEIMAPSAMPLVSVVVVVLVIVVLAPP